MEGAKGRNSGLKCPWSCQQTGIYINTVTTIASTVGLIYLLMNTIFEEIDDSNGHDEVTYIEAVIMFFLSTIWVISLSFTVYLAYTCSVANTTDVLILKQR